MTYLINWDIVWFDIPKIVHLSPLTELHRQHTWGGEVPVHLGYLVAEKTPPHTHTYTGNVTSYISLYTSNTYTGNVTSYISLYTSNTYTGYSLIPRTVEEAWEWGWSHLHECEVVEDGGTLLLVACLMSEVEFIWKVPSYLFGQPLEVKVREEPGHTRHQELGRRESLLPIMVKLFSYGVRALHSRPSCPCQCRRSSPRRDVVSSLQRPFHPPWEPHGGTAQEKQHPVVLHPALRRSHQLGAREEGDQSSQSQRGRRSLSWLLLVNIVLTTISDLVFLSLLRWPASCVAEG